MNRRDEGVIARPRPLRNMLWFVFAKGEVDEQRQLIFEEKYKFRPCSKPRITEFSD